MKKVFSILALSLIAFSCLFFTGCKNTGLVNKNFKLESASINQTTDITNDVKDYSLSFFETTFKFELCDSNEHNYGFYIGSYNLTDQTVTLSITAYGEALSGTPAQNKLTFVYSTMTYKDGKLTTVTVSDSGDEYIFVFVEK